MDSRYKYYALKLVGICFAVFFIQIIFGESFTEMFLVNQNSYPEIWRFITGIFLHSDIAHLLYNMFALALFGSILERIIGGRRFLTVYFASGIIANIFAVNFYTSSLGASGAIYGILGALIILRPMMVVFAFGIPMPMIIAGIAWILGDIIGLFIPSNIGHIAHLTGIAIGMIFGIIYRRKFKEEKKEAGVTLDEDKMRRWEDEYLK